MDTNRGSHNERLQIHMKGGINAGNIASMCRVAGLSVGIKGIQISARNCLCVEFNIKCNLRLFSDELALQ